jgi:hypothetical protein
MSESQKKKNFGGDSPAQEPAPGGKQTEKRNTVTGGGCSRNARSEDRAKRTEAAKMKMAWAHSTETDRATVAQAQNSYCTTENHEGRKIGWIS